MAIVNLNYGHRGSGQTYAYRDPSGTHRAGDEVVVEVTKGGKTYKTMGVIRSTHASGTVGEQDTEEFLAEEGIGLKPILGGSQKQLPGYYAGWAKDAKAAYELQVEARLGMFKGESNSIKRYTDSVRRETKQQYDNSIKKRLGVG